MQAGGVVLLDDELQARLSTLGRDIAAGLFRAGEITFLMVCR
jgi:hypothetical protein